MSLATDQNLSAPLNQCVRGWCCLGFRFEPGEQALARSAERMYGEHLAADGQPDRDRLVTLARAGARVTGAAPLVEVKLDEAQTRALLAAVRFAAGTESPDRREYLGLADRLAQALRA